MASSIGEVAGSAKWRKKQMPLVRLIDFQRRFTTLRALWGDQPQMALFVQRGEGEQRTTFITGGGFDLLEAFSPGGWEESDAPQQGDLELLVGPRDAWERYATASHR